MKNLEDKCLWKEYVEKAIEEINGDYAECKICDGYDKSCYSYSIKNNTQPGGSREVARKKSCDFSPHFNPSTTSLNKRNIYKE